MTNTKLQAFPVLLSLFCCSYAANAQAGNPANQWTQLSPEGGPPDPRQAQSAVFDPQTDSLIIFGGTADECEGDCDFNDVWSLSFGASPQWTQINPNGTPPSPRNGASAAYDSGNSQFIIFGGGQGYYSCENQNDTWVLSDANGINDVPAWTQLTPAGSPPAARTFHTAVYDPRSNRMIVFGGSSCLSEESTQFYNDTWILANANGLGDTPAWTQLTFTGPVPPARGNHTAVYDAVSNRMIIFGGANGIGELNDVWVLSNANGVTGTPTWTQLSPTGTLPSPRAGSTATYDPATNRTTVFGGNDDENMFNDVWVLSNSNGATGTPAWTQLQPQGTLPDTRWLQAAAFNPFTNQMMIFGGEGSDGSFDDAWLLTNASGPLVITTNALPNGSVTLPYSANPLIRSGNAPLTWSVNSGSLPAGLALNSSTGAITGTPTSAGSFTFGLQVTDGSSPQQITSQTFALTVTAATAPNFQQYAIPTSNTAPSAITSGPDGAMWFTEYQGNNVGRISPSGVITEYPIPTATAQPEGIVTGPDGALWFTELQGDNIGRITTLGAISEYQLGLTDPPTGIASGPDGALWFAEQNTFEFGRISTSGTVTQFELPDTQYSTYNIVDTAAGPDGALWFTDNGNDEIGQITTSGSVTEFPIPTPNSAPSGIVAGPDGALWFTEAGPGANKIGRITTTGVITEYSIPTPNSGPSSIVAGQDGALWFAEIGGGKIGRVTTSGAMTEFAAPAGNSPNAIALGPDGALWFTGAANSVGRLSFVGALGLVCTVSGAPMVNAMYAAGCTASGGTSPYTYSMVAGTLPPGMILNASTGTISGTPVSAGSFSFTLQLTDSTSPAQVASYAVNNLVVQPTTLTLVCSAPTGAQVGSAYLGTCTVSGGTPSYTFSIISGTLPPGLSVTSTGAIAGMPTSAGIYSFNVQVADTGIPTPQIASQTLSISVSAPIITPPATPTFSLCTPSTTSSTCTSLPTTQAPAQPLSLGMQLNQTTSVAIDASLTLSFAASAADVSAGYMDPALQFVDSNGKQLGTSYNVTVPAGTTSVTLPSMQPGTVAGAITVTLTVGGVQAAASTITIEPLAPVIEPNSVQILNVTATGFDVEVVASSTSREVTAATLSFTAATGSKITSTASFSVDLSSVLGQWYSSTEGQSYGSLFSLTVPFTFSGSASAIQSVTVTLTNSIGTSSPVTGTQ